MKKRLLALFAVVALAVLPTFAALSVPALKTTTKPTWSVGVALGTTSGVTAKYRMNKDLTFAGTIGFAALNGSLTGEGYGMYKVTDFNIDKAKFDVNVGAGAAVDVEFGNAAPFSVSALGVAELSYSFNDQAPWDVALRVAPGIMLNFTGSGVTPKFTIPASLIGMYRFL